MHAPHLIPAEVVAPALPGFVADGALAIATLAAVLLCVVAYGLHEGWNHSIGWGLRWLANQCHRAPSISIPFIGQIDPLYLLGDLFEWIDHGIAHSLATLYLDSEKAVVYLWHLTGVVFWWSVNETKALSLDLYHALRHMVVVTVPDAAKWARRDAIATARSLVHREAAARRAVDGELRHLAHVAEADAELGIRKAEHALDWSEAQVGHIGKEIDALRARLHGIERMLRPAAIVALIGATIFKEFGLGWLRCSNVGRMGRFLCGLPLGLLDDLLALEVVALVASDVCAFADSVQRIAHAIRPFMLDLVDAEDALVGCHGATRPPDLPLPTVHYPPANRGLQLAD